MSTGQYMPDTGDSYGSERRRSSVNVSGSSSRARQSLVVIPSTPDKYVYYRLTKKGRFWTEASCREISVPQSQLEKLSKKSSRAKVAEEKRTMGRLRGIHFDRLVDDLNARETGEAVWEAVVIKTERVTTRNGVEVKAMDVVLARAPKSGDVGEVPVVVVARRSGTENLVLVKNQTKGNEGGEWFGKPIDEYGPLNFDNAGLLPEILPDLPIGAARETDDQMADSKEKNEAIPSIEDLEPLVHEPGALRISVDDFLGEHSRGNSRTGSLSVRDSTALPDWRSPPRRRRQQPAGRTRGSRSRSRSRSRPSLDQDEVRFPRVNNNWNGLSSSSDPSDISIVELDRSPRTSQDTHRSLAGEGGRQYHDDDDGYKRHRSKSRERKRNEEYSEYSQQPSRSNQAITDQTSYQSSTTGRRGFYHDRLSESRQIDRPTATYDNTRRPIVRYPNELVDTTSLSRQSAPESYIIGRARHEELSWREQDLEEGDKYYDDGSEDDYQRQRYSRDGGSRYHGDNTARRSLGDDGLGSGGTKPPTGKAGPTNHACITTPSPPVTLLQLGHRRPKDILNEPALADSEREAVADLLQYLENRAETDFFSGEPLRALSTLVYSDNVELQRSASLTFAEITERDVREVDRETLEPILMLLQNDDIEVQRAASAALGNLAVNTENKVAIVQLGGLPPLIRQMMSQNVEVQCNAVGCITNLATHEDNKAKIARSGALGPLTRLAKSKDSRVQRNATGALLNMTHSDDNRQQLVNAGAIPVLVQLLQSPDMDVQYYCTTALSNIAVDASNRKKLAQTEPKLVQSLVQLMDSGTPKVQCQAALALRNLASDEKYQLEIVRAKGLTPLMHLLQASYIPLVLSAVACIRNISIHPLNESPIIDAGFLKPLVNLLGSTDNEEIQCHAISTLRNLAASSDKNKQLVLDAGAVQKCKELVLSVPLSVQSEMTAAIAVLALSDELKTHLLKLGVFDCLIPLTASESIEVQGNSAAALGNLSSKVGDYSIFVRDWAEPNGGIHGYLRRFLDSGDATFQHIAIWTLLQLLESEDKKLIGLVAKSEDIIQMVRTIADRHVESDDEEAEEGEGEVVALAQRSLELLGKGPKQTLVEGNSADRVGSTVLCRVLRVQQRQLIASILVTDPTPASYVPLTTTTNDELQFQAVLRREDVRGYEKDKIVMNDMFRTADIIRAVVISLGDERSYYISTIGNENGVLIARSEAGNPMVPATWNSMLDAVTGKVESRKVAKPSSSS
ncbi:hypothetical protein DV738_g4742, partial [Chaetothyriales sp. CBS 135597]